ncbi:MAG: response regulator [Gammaproteobacteria bacterium]|nr:response regulator [Gammaproteobacteria bacterium]
MTSGREATGLRVPSANQPLKLAVVDDNALFRRTLVRLIGRQPELTMIAEAASGAEMMALLTECDPELLLLDLEIGAESGFDLLPRALASRPDLAVILLTGHDPLALQGAAVEGGAQACWSKSDLRELLGQLARAGAAPESLSR